MKNFWKWLTTYRYRRYVVQVTNKEDGYTSYVYDKCRFGRSAVADMFKTRTEANAIIEALSADFTWCEFEVKTADVAKGLNINISVKTTIDLSGGSSC